MHKAKRYIIYFCIFLHRLIHGIKKNTVVFISFDGKTYSDNPRGISEMLYKMAPEIEIKWLFINPESKKNTVPSYVKAINAGNTIKIYLEMATAGVFVSNFSLPLLHKNKKQLFIQTWHGDKAFKKILYDSAFMTADKLVSESIDGYCDYAIAGSEYGERQYRSAFRYTGEIINQGMPRNDKLININQEEISKIKTELGICSDTGVLMYAPTLRRKNQGNRTAQEVKGLNISSLLSILENKYNKKWVCLLRAHPAVDTLGNINCDERIIDVTKYEDMSDLLLISDMLITDYSSCAGDFALLRRPIILFQCDREEYMKKDRTFYFNIEDSPYFVAESQEEIEVIINDMSVEKAKRNCEEILEFYGNTETGRSSEIVAQKIIEWVKAD